jgi:hypothetical protein
MAFGGEKIEELLANFTAFHNLHPSLIMATDGTRSDFEPAGQGAHHTIERSSQATSLQQLPCGEIPAIRAVATVSRIFAIQSVT